MITNHSNNQARTRTYDRRLCTREPRNPLSYLATRGFEPSKCQAKALLVAACATPFVSQCFITLMLIHIAIQKFSQLLYGTITEEQINSSLMFSKAIEGIILIISKIYSYFVTSLIHLRSHLNLS